MYRLFAFISRNRHAFTFLLLEGLAFWIIIRFNGAQKSRFGDFILEISGRYYQSESRVLDYFSLREQNALLLENLSRMEQELEKAQRRADLNLELLNKSHTALKLLPGADSSVARETFLFSPGKVLRHSIDRSYNYLTIDRGRRDGIRQGMGVVSPSGVAGVVVQVSDQYCLALSALNLSFSVTLKAVKDRQFISNGVLGFFEWDGKSSRRGFFRFVPDAEGVAPGDLLVTAGYSTIFPEGIPFGKVLEVAEVGDDGLSVAEIELATNFSRLSYIYFVGALHKEALDSLTQGLPDA